MLETLKALKQKGFRSTTMLQSPIFCLFFGIFSAFFELILSKLCVYAKKKRIFVNKNAFLVGRGGFEAKMPSVTLYFKGAQRHAPQTLQHIFLFIYRLIISFYFKTITLLLIFLEIIFCNTISPVYSRSIAELRTNNF